MKPSPAQLSGAELQQQRAEIRRGLRRVTTASAVIVLVVLALASAAVVAAVRAKRQAELARAATQQGQERLWEARLAQARAVRWSEQAGRRFEAIAAIQEAARLRPARELRDEAIASLALVDLGAPKWFIPHPPDARVPAQYDARNPRFGPDLERVAWALTNGGIRIVRARDRTEETLCRGPGEALLGFCWSPDGNYLAARYAEETWVWDVPRRAVVIKTGSPSSRRTADIPLAFSADSHLVGIGLGNELVLYQLPNGTEWKRRAPVPKLSTFYFHPQQPWLALCADNHVDIWDWQAERMTNQFATSFSINHVAWSPNGRLLAAASQSGAVSVWDVVTRRRNTLDQPSGPPVHVVFANASDKLAVVGEQGSTALWDALSPNMLLKTYGGKGHTFSRDDTGLGFWSHDGVGVWPVANPGPTYAQLTGLMDQELDAAIDFSPDGRWMASVSDLVGGLWLWDLVSRQLVGTQSAPRCRWVQFTSDGEALITAGQNEILRFPLETRSGGGLPEIGIGKSFGITNLPPATGSPAAASKPRSISAACLTPDGQRVLVGFGKGQVAILDARTFEERGLLQCQERISAMAVSPDAERLATVPETGEGTWIWEMAGGKLLRQLPAPSARVAFSPEGRWLVIGAPTRFEFRDAQSFALIKSLAREQPYENPPEMAFSPTQPILACRRSKYNVELIDTSTLEEVATIQIPNQFHGRKLRFSRDGHYLGIHDRGSVHLWHLPSLRQELKALGLDWGQQHRPAALDRLASASGSTLATFDPGLFFSLALAGAGLVILCALFVLQRQRRLMAAYLQVDQQIEERDRQLVAAQIEVQLAQKMKALGTLAAGIAHDFNNLLSVIRMSNQLTAESARGHAEIEENVAEVEQAVQQGKKVVRSMLGYSRKESDEAGPFVCAELVEETVALLTKQFLNGIALTLELDRSLPPLHLSRNRLEQILLNLIVNASEAMKGNGRLQIIVRRSTNADGIAALRSRTAARYAELLVIDSGPGISPELLPRIFEPFFTTKNRDATRGTGLGLSTVYTIAEQDGLGIAVKSAPSNGSEFRIILPLD